MIALSLTEIADAVDGVLHLAGLTGDHLADGGALAGGSLTASGSVQTDSRLVEPGSIFFAMRGTETDGHLFASVAVDKGATLLVVEDLQDLPVAQIVVVDSLEALAALARRVVQTVRETGNLTVIGITGSNGKTTTKNMLRAILSDQGPTVAPKGSFNNEVGAPITMLAIDSETRFLVVEMGASAVGDIARSVAIARPDIAVVLKVGLAHSGEFGGIEITQRAKSEIVTSLTPSDVAILNIDDERVAAMAAMTEARPVWFGLDSAADVRADDLRATAAGTAFSLITDGQSRQVTLRILGEHHVMNALAAIAVARELGLPLDEVVASLESVERRRALADGASHPRRWRDRHQRRL